MHIERDAEKARAGAVVLKVQQPSALRILLTAPSSCVSRQHLRQLDLLEKLPLNLYEELAVHLNSANSHRSSLPSLEVLSLAGSCCGDAAVSAILPALSNHPNLSVLDLSSCLLTDAAGSRVASVIRAQAAAAAQLEWAATLRSGVHTKASNPGPAHAAHASCTLAADTAVGWQQATKAVEQGQCVGSSCSKGLQEVDLSSNQLTSSTLSTLASALANRHCCATLLNLSFNPQLPPPQEAAAELHNALLEDPPPHRLTVQLLQHALPISTAEATGLVSSTGSTVAAAAASSPRPSAKQVSKMPASAAVAVAAGPRRAQLHSPASSTRMHRVLSSSSMKAGSEGHAFPLRTASTVTSRKGLGRAQGPDAGARYQGTSSSNGGRRSAAGVNAPTNEDLKLWEGVFVWQGATANAKPMRCTPRRQQRWRQRQHQVDEQQQRLLQSTSLAGTSSGRTPLGDSTTVADHQPLHRKHLQQQQCQLSVTCTKQQSAQGADQASAPVDAQEIVTAQSGILLANVPKLSLYSSPAGPVKTAQLDAACAAIALLDKADCDGAMTQPAEVGRPAGRSGSLTFMTEQRPEQRAGYLQGCSSDCHTGCNTHADNAPTLPCLPRPLEPQQQQQQRHLHQSQGRPVTQLQELLFAEDSEDVGGETAVTATRSHLQGQRCLQPAVLHHDVADVRGTTLDNAAGASQCCLVQVQQRHSSLPGTPLQAAPGCTDCSAFGCRSPARTGSSGAHSRPGLPDKCCQLHLPTSPDVQAARFLRKRVNQQLEVYQLWTKQHQAPLTTRAAQQPTSHFVPSQQHSRRLLSSKTCRINGQHPIACEQQQQQCCMGTAGHRQDSQKLHAKHGASSRAVRVGVAGAGCTRPVSPSASVVTSDGYPGPRVHAAAQTGGAKSHASPRQQQHCQQGVPVNPPAPPALPVELVRLAQTMCGLTDQVSQLEGLVYGSMMSKGSAAHQIH